jgi:hypothetical protein
VAQCISEAIVQGLGDSALEEFDRNVSQLPPTLCAPFHAEARQLETQLLGIYKMIALCARETDDLAIIAERWGWMVNLCDHAATRIQSLTEDHPYCGADVYTDRIFDLRNKCQRLQKMHL